MFSALINSNGKLQLKNAAVASAVGYNGMQVANAAAFVNTAGGVPGIVTNGLPFSTAERMLVSTAAINRYYNGLPFDSDGSLCVEAAAVSYIHAGVPFTAAGKIAVEYI